MTYPSTYKPTEISMDDRTAILLAKADLVGNDAALACCDAFLSMFPARKEPNFMELSQVEEK